MTPRLLLIACIHVAVVAAELYAVDWPQTDGRLDYIESASAGHLAYPPYITRIENAPLLLRSFLPNTLSDEIRNSASQYRHLNNGALDAYLSSDGPVSTEVAAAHWQLLMNLIENSNPDTMIGSYMSGSNAAHGQLGYPLLAVDSHEFPGEFAIDANEHGLYRYNPALTERYYVDLHQPTSREELGVRIVEQANMLGLPFIMLDNINYLKQGQTLTLNSVETNITSEDIFDHLEFIHSHLDHGIGLYTNVAVTPAAISPDDYNRLAETVDGIGFEQPFHKNWRKTVDGISREVGALRAFLDRDVLVTLIGREAPREWIAGMVMAAVRDEPSDSIFVNRPHFKSITSDVWATWPELFGTPLGDGELLGTDNSWAFQRQFETGKGLVVQHVNVTEQETDFELLGGVEWDGEGSRSVQNGDLLLLNSSTLAEYRLSESFSGTDLLHRTGHDADGVDWDLWLLITADYTVPEPSSISLLLVAIGLIQAMRRDSWIRNGAMR